MEKSWNFIFQFLWEPCIRNVVTIAEFELFGFYFFCAVNRTQPIDWFTAFTHFLYYKCKQRTSPKLEKKMSSKSE